MRPPSQYFLPLFKESPEGSSPIDFIGKKAYISVSSCVNLCVRLPKEAYADKKEECCPIGIAFGPGRGGAGVAAGTAEAGIIYTPLSGKVGFSNGYGLSASTLVASTTFLHLVRTNTAKWNGISRTAHTSRYLVKLFGWWSGLAFKPGDALGGQRWGDLHSAAAKTVTLKGTRRLVTHWRQGRGPGYFTTTASGARNHVSTSTWLSSVKRSHSGSNGDFYKLFQFFSSSANQYDYGWVSLYQSMSDTSGPDIDLLGMAYDDSGAQIAAGDTGASTPEPSTLSLSGLAALALGAVGLRRWRAARKRAA